MMNFVVGHAGTFTVAVQVYDNTISSCLGFPENLVHIWLHQM